MLRICKLHKTVDDLSNVAMDVMGGLMALAICAVTNANPEQAMPTFFAIAQGMMAIYDAVQIDIAHYVLDLVIMEYFFDASRVLALFSSLVIVLLVILMMNGHGFTLVSRVTS